MCTILRYANLHEKNVACIFNKRVLKKLDYCNMLEPKSSRNSSLLCDILIFVFIATCSLLMTLEKISSALSTLTGCFWYSMSSNCMYNFSLV